ncbi:MAG: M48 family metallopeptidase [Rhodospirillales bacterium]|nr:M48 family metallopeptidase [Rhodospirillales bacterium]
MPSVSGRYSDGNTASVRQVRIEIRADGFSISGTDGDLLATWHFDEIELIDDLESNSFLTLARTSQPGARLTIEGAAPCAEILAAIPALSQRRRYPLPSLRQTALYAGIVAAFAVALWFALPKVVDATVRLIPHSWENRIGESVIENVANVFSDKTGDQRFCSTKRGDDALNLLVSTLAGDLHIDFDVRVLDTPVVNALAAPGGHILLFRGLIDQAETPDEVAGVLAHEMAHVIERHATQNAVRQLGLSVVLRALFGDPGMLQAAAESAIGLSYSRDAEAEADRIATELLAGAQISNEGLVSFFTRLAAKRSGQEGLLRYLSTHPPLADRAKLLPPSPNAARPSMTDRNWQRLRSICS